MLRTMHNIEEYLHSQEIEADLIQEVAAFRNQYSVAPEVQERIAAPSLPFYGKDTLEMALSAILQGENLLLSGGKATGKNVLCETLSWVFGRPSYDISFHVNTDSASLIGTDTFRDNEVTLRKGPITLCAETGGFGVLDEINMAKNDAVSVLHATLDHRRRIDIPGYSRITLHPATRFIGTMNLGYAGTRELNEALVSRFLVIEMPPLDEPEAGGSGAVFGAVSRSAEQSVPWRNIHQASGPAGHDCRHTHHPFRAETGQRHPHRSPQQVL